MSTNPLFAVLALLSICGGSAMARNSTSNDSDAPSVKISFRDLDLSTPEGGRAMLARIHTAAKTVCGTVPYDPIWRRYEYDPCVNTAIDRAVTRLGNPVVTALNGGHRSKEPVALASR